MNHLKFYINATPGGTDGTEIDPSGLVFKNLLSAMTRYGYNSGKGSNWGAGSPTSGLMSFGVSMIPLAMRCDIGFRAIDVKIKGYIGTDSKWISGTGGNFITPEDL